MVKSFWKVPVARPDSFGIRPMFAMLSLLALAHFARSETPLLERTVTISLNEERLDIALTRISQQAGFTFSYNPSVVDISRIVTFNFAGNTVREVLELLFEGAIQYKVRGNYVILTKAAKPPGEQVYSGYVVDEATGKRLQNVSVYDPLTMSSAVTDEYGFFKIKIEKPTAEEVRLAVARREYGDTVVAVSPSRNGLLKIPMNFNEERISTLADSVAEKLRRFWHTKVLAPENINIHNIKDTLYRTSQVSVWPFIGSNHTLSGNVINDYSFNIFGGYALGVKKLEIGGLFNVDRGDIYGTQLATIFNAVGGKAHGFQGAGLLNLNLDSVKGGRFAGVANVSWAGTEKFSAAGVLNFTHGRSGGVHLAGVGNFNLGEQQGTQLAGVFNFTTRSTGPVHIAGVMNFTAGNHVGGQGAGVMNFSAGNVTGAQGGGMINFAAKKLTGAQVSGVLNYATDVHGLQLGLVNIADSVKGVPIGLFSFVMEGYHQLEFSADEVFYTNVAFRTGVSHFYNIFTAGAKPSTFGDEQTYWTAGYGVGTAPKLSRRLRLNADVTANQIFSGYTLAALNIVSKLYAGIEYHPLPKFGLVAGITLNAHYTDSSFTEYPELFSEFQPTIIHEMTYDNNINVKMWLGAKVGFRFF
ncbi:MAG TPA: STN and carboxypeptidase regulatory-like domain-containing protein [Chryseolinea sp.]|nr:STN and carboxypeptidase regulatory-like domain-containing protein [Chryseolinea sp.]